MKIGSVNAAVSLSRTGRGSGGGEEGRGGGKGKERRAKKKKRTRKVVLRRKQRALPESSFGTVTIKRQREKRPREGRARAFTKNSHNLSIVAVNSPNNFRPAARKCPHKRLVMPRPLLRPVGPPPLREDYTGGNAESLPREFSRLPRPSAFEFCPLRGSRRTRRLLSAMCTAFAVLALSPTLDHDP